MTREAFIRKWLGAKHPYTEQFRDEMRDDLDKVIEYANRSLLVWESEQLKASAEYLQTRPDFAKMSNIDLAIDFCDSL